MEMFEQLCDMEYKEKLLFRIYMLEELKKLKKVEKEKAREWDIKFWKEKAEQKLKNYHRDRVY